MAKCDKIWHFVPLFLFGIFALFIRFTPLELVRIPTNSGGIGVSFNADYILSDREGLISENFKIPYLLKNRVGFWFKIYSQYTIDHSVIHDTDHPWIIYDVVNAYELRSRGIRGSRVRSKQLALAKIKRAEYRAILLKLSRNPYYKSLNGREKRVYHLFDSLPGNRQKLFARAAYRIRRQEGQRDSLIHGLRKSGAYWSKMEKVLKKNGVPSELITLPLLESSFVVEARSKAGAAGVWQFMRKTGTKLFNYVRSDIDERYDPIKATRAAAELLKQNYQILKSWPLAVNAYNTGPGILLKAKSTLQTNNIGTIINKFRARGWGFASKNYYPSFLASLYVTKYYPLIFGNLRRDPPMVHDEEIVIRYPMLVSFITKLCKVSVKDLKQLNPDLRAKSLSSLTYLPRNYYLKLPLGHRKYLEEFHREVEGVNAKFVRLGIPR